MKVSEFQNEVARAADTDGTAINVATTKRVIAVTFDELVKLDVAEATDIIAKSLAAAKKRATAKPVKKKARKK